MKYGDGREEAHSCRPASRSHSQRQLSSELSGRAFRPRRAGKRGGALSLALRSAQFTDNMQMEHPAIIYSELSQSEIWWQYIQFIGRSIMRAGPLLYAGTVTVWRWNAFNFTDYPEYCSAAHLYYSILAPNFGRLSRLTWDDFDQTSPITQMVPIYEPDFSFTIL